MPTEVEGLPRLHRELLETGESDIEVLDFRSRSVFILFTKGLPTFTMIIDITFCTFTKTVQAITERFDFKFAKR